MNVSAIALGVAAILVASSAHADPAANKKLVLAMWHGVIEQADEAAVMRYIAPGYIQHNTNLDTGREALLEGVRRLKNPPPGTPPHRSKTLVAAVAEGDLVTLTWTREEPDPANPAHLVKWNRFDMFRVKDGLVVEHWDDSAPAR